MSAKEYLGDGVYVALDRFGTIVLTTEDGISVTNTIYLEPEVIQELMHYLARARAERQQAKF